MGLNLQRTARFCCHTWTPQAELAQEGGLLQGHDPALETPVEGKGACWLQRPLAASGLGALDGAQQRAAWRWGRSGRPERHYHVPPQEQRTVSSHPSVTRAG